MNFSMGIDHTMKFCGWLPILALVASGLTHATSVFGQSRDVCLGGASQAEIVATHGDVSLTTAEGQNLSAQTGTILCPGDRLDTADGAGVDLRFAGKDTVTNILSNSTVVLPEPDQADISLQSGLLRFISSVRGVFLVRTPHTDAGIDGTEAMLAVDGPALDTLVLVREGIVTARDRRDQSITIALLAGNASYSSQTQQLVPATLENVPAKFRQYLLNPEGAADWAVYYPPILLGSGVDDADLRRAAGLLDAGDPDGAQAVLDGYQGGDAAAASALGAMVAVFRNRVADGLTLSRDAVGQNPNLGAAQIARSYALQAAGQVDAARDAARTATKVDASNAYAWSRYAELELTLGNRGTAQEAAETSLSLAETALGRAILGFANLATGDRDAAKEAFQKAILLDDNAPLPRLGLGLALVNEGDLESGRREMETAAALDPQRAQLRGWLGRAYLQEGLSEKALAQFRLAQEQDPDDPTAWLFEAEERFAANQPLAAIRALQKAAELSGGRATVQGRRGLGDQDAAQAAAAGRAFDTVGFSDQAVQTAARGVQTDPTNPGAHRLLADLYRDRPGNEISQSSERLVGQLLSGPTNDPIQLELGEADLSLLDVAGPARISFQEFNPLIQSDGIRFLGQALIGTRETFADEVSLSLKEGNFSVAAAQFHYQTNGFAVNNDVTHDIVSLEIRGEPVPGLKIFAEAKGRNTERGDRTIDFLGDTNETLRSEEQRISFRLGGHAEINDYLDLLVVGTFADFDATDSTSDSIFTPAGIISTTLTENETAHGGDIQAQLIGNYGAFTVQAGASALVLNNGGQTATDTTFPAFNFPPFVVNFCFPPAVFDGVECRSTLTTPIDRFDRHYSGYVYGTYAPVEEVDLTLGLSVDHLRNEFRNNTSINPKAGLVVRPIDEVVLRGAFAKTLKRPFILDQTIEPTTIAGFNQFFDDEDGAEALMYAAGFDLNPIDNLWVGGEFVYRDLATPLELFGPGLAFGEFGGEERRYRGYANLALGDYVALSAGIQHIEAQSDVVTRVSSIRTTKVPVSVSFFSDIGVFASVTGTYIKQGITDLSTVGLPFKGEDQGVILDAAVGYRLPNKRGVISLEVQNFTDQSINFQDETTFADRPVTPSFARELTFLGRVSISLD
ncbi:MAG: TonB-dependent receptor [Pseudomonadota bacterium]